MPAANVALRPASWPSHGSYLSQKSRAQLSLIGNFVVSRPNRPVQPRIDPAA
jgi:hypothetical protein